MSNQSLKHVHTYVRYKKKFGELYYRCEHPLCHHMAPKDSLFGKATICSICHQTEFILTWKDLLRAKPRCLNCSNTAEAVSRRKLASVLGEILVEKQ